MAMKKNLRWLPYFSLLLIMPSFANIPLGETLQVSTHFKSITGKPTWLLIVREVETGRVLPYQFDIRNNDNFWLAFTSGHSYRVTASNLSFGPFAKIKNFCNLEDGIINGESYFVTLTGDLTPDPTRFRCKIIKYKDLPFPIASHTGTSSE